MKFISEKEITRKQICDSAKKFIGSPYHHQGRNPAAGIDCAGLIVCVAKDLDIYPENADYGGYSMRPDGKQLIKQIRDFCTNEKQKEDAKPGDILLMTFIDSPQHLAIMLEDNYVCHSFLAARKCIMHKIDQEWGKKIIRVFEFPCKIID